MARYSDLEIQRLLDHLDALDVLELIDYHPESILRDGDIVHSWCPLCQDHSDRYLTVDLAKKTFRSEPPHIPPQSGSIIDLYARARRFSVDDAVQQLAEEFNILLMDPGAADHPTEFIEEAEQLLRQARSSSGAEMAALLTEAEKRFQRFVRADSKNLRALRGLQQIRLLQRNVVELLQVTGKLIAALKEAGDLAGVADAANVYLSAEPEDVRMRREYAEGLAAGGNGDEARAQFMAAAEKAAKAGYHEESLAVYRRMLDLNIAPEEALRLLAANLKGRNRGDEAVRLIQDRIEVLKSQKKFTEASRAAEFKLLVRPNDDDVRIQVIELALLGTMDDTTKDRCMAMVDAMIAAGHNERAAEGLSYLLADDADSIPLIEKLIGIQEAMGDLDMRGELLHRLAEIHRQKRNPEAAAAIYEERLKENREDARALEALGELRVEEGQIAAAITMLREAVEIHLMNINEAEALRCIQRIVDIDDTQWPDREREIEILWAIGQRDEAATRLDDLAEDFAAAGLGDRLVALLRTQHKRAPDDDRLLSRLYKELVGSGRHDAALELARDTIKRAGTDTNRVITVLREFLKVRPDDPALLWKLADIRLEVGQKAEALETYLALDAVYTAQGQMQARHELLKSLRKAWPAEEELNARLSESSLAVGDEATFNETAPVHMAGLISQRRLEEAIQMGRRFLERDAGNVRILAMMQDIYAKLGRAVEEAEVSERLLAAHRTREDRTAETQLLVALLGKAPQRADLAERLLELLASAPDPNDLVRRLDDFLDRHRAMPDRCLGVLRRIIAINPSSVEARLRLVSLLKKLGRKDERLAELQAAIERLEEAHDNERLILLYRDLLDARPDNLIARERLVDLLRSTGKASEATHETLRLARYYRDLRMLKESAASYERLYEEDPNNEAVLRAHAELLEEMGQPEAAARKLRLLAGVVADRGRTPEAIEVLRGLANRSASDHATRRTLIDLLRNGQRFEEAAGELGSLATALREQGDLKGAIESRREAVTMLPGRIDLRQLLIGELEAGSLQDEARVEQIALADTLARSGQPQKALGVVDQIVQEDPGNLRARRLRAQIHDSLGDEKRALAEYREMQALMEKMPTVVAAGPAAPQREEFDGGLQIIPEYTFDNFIVGVENNFAYATAKAVADHPGTGHNPLFLYSDVGLGKTHLLHGIANSLRARKPDIRILYASTEYFTSALIEAIQNNTVTQFRNRHRRCDVLLLDDVQFLAGKERSQEEFFHLFNVLHQDGRQIVVTSDRPPKDIAHLDMRIRSRFAQGVIVDIQPPELETRTAILQAEAVRRGIDVPPVAIAVLAERINSSVRELKGAFNQLLTQHQLLGSRLEAETANAIVDKFYAT